jgi:beta-phosphoglucomutase
MQGKRIKCLIFDLDGTLFDTKKANAVAYQKAFSCLGVKMTKDDYEKVFGLRFREMAKKIAPNLSESELKKVKKIKSRYYREFVYLIKANYALFELIRHFRNTCKIFLVTTASRRNVLFLLSYFKIKKYFDYVLCGESVERAKPYPDCYKVCFKKAGVSPKEALIFEDSKIGIEAARKSGANYCVVKMK